MDKDTAERAFESLKREDYNGCMEALRPHIVSYVGRFYDRSQPQDREEAVQIICFDLFKSFRKYKIYPKETPEAQLMQFRSYLTKRISGALASVIRSENRLASHHTPIPYEYTPSDRGQAAALISRSPHDIFTSNRETQLEEITQLLALYHKEIPEETPGDTRQGRASNRRRESMLRFEGILQAYLDTHDGNCDELTRILYERGLIQSQNPNSAKPALLRAKEELKRVIEEAQRRDTPSWQDRILQSTPAAAIAL